MSARKDVRSMRHHAGHVAWSVSSKAKGVLAGGHAVDRGPLDPGRARPDFPGARRHPTGSKGR